MCQIVWIQIRPNLFWPCSEFMLFAKVISRQQKIATDGEELWNKHTIFSSIYPILIWDLKENAVNEETCAVSVQNTSHNINLVRIGKWRQLNKISVRLNTKIVIFHLLESAIIDFGLVPVFTSAITVAQESLSLM